jgi:predicted amidohydrolase
VNSHGPRKLVAVLITCLALFAGLATTAQAAVPPATASLLTGTPLSVIAGRSVAASAAAEPAAEPAASVKVATIEFAPEEGKVAANVARMVTLATEAGENGAKMIVLPEMATSGYSFFSRAEIATVAETVPGASTAAIGAVAKKFGAYIAFGMPEYEPKKNLYFNTAVLIGPEGEVAGTYHKRNNLLEASYNAEVYEPMPTFETPYGKVALAICSDIFYPQFARAAAVSGATILLAPANTYLETNLARVRTYENDFSIVVANRYGVGTAGTKPESFSQETFTIPSPFAYEWEFGDQSLIMNEKGELLAALTEPKDAIGYGELPIRSSRTFPVERKPAMYSLIGQDTLQEYTQTQLGLPAPAKFAAAALDPGPSATPWTAALGSVEKAKSDAEAEGETLRLAVLPADYFASEEPAGFAALKSYSEANNVDIEIGYEKTATEAPKSVLIGSNGKTYTYVRTHRAKGEGIKKSELSNEYLVVDRDYGRVALMQGTDMIPPETGLVLQQMGVDVVAVDADSSNPVLPALWEDRSANYMNIVVANKAAPEGIYLGGYQDFPAFTEGEGEVIREINTAHDRKKPYARFFDYKQILKPCSKAADNC